MRRRITLLAATGALLLLPSVPATAAEPTLSGVVSLGGRTAGPVPVAWYTPGSSTVTVTRTDAEGRFSMPAPPAGTRYLLAANVADLLTEPHAANIQFLPAFVGAGSGADDVPAAPLVQPATADGAGRTVAIDVGRATQIRGITAAFAGSGVELQTLNGEVADFTTADEQGGWGFRVAPGEYRIAVGAHGNWLAYRSAVLHVRMATLVVASSPDRTASLRGTVTSPAGRPVKGAYVSVSGPAGIAYPDILGVRTDDRGRYLLGGLAPARYAVRIGAPGTGSLVVQERSVKVPLGKQVRVDARLRRGASLTATVRVPSSRPRWKALLQDAHGSVVRTAGSLRILGTTTGPLSFTALPAGRYRLLIVNGDRILDRRIRIAPRKAVRLGVITPKAPALKVDGTAPAGAYITMELGPITVRTTAAADGSFHLAGLVPGAWKTRSQTSGHLWADSTTIVPATGPLTLTDGAAVETEFHPVHGTVTAGGIPIPVAAVHLQGGSFLGIADGRLGDGRTASNILSPGTYDVTSVTVRSEIASLFPRATPYYLTWTGPRIVVERGSDPDIGTLDLAVRGGP